MKEANKVFGEYIDSYNTETEYNWAYKLLPHVSEINGKIKYIPLGYFDNKYVYHIWVINDFGDEYSSFDPNEYIRDNIERIDTVWEEGTGILVGKIGISDKTYYLWRINVTGRTMFISDSSKDDGIRDVCWGLTEELFPNDEEYYDTNTLWKDAERITLIDDNKKHSYSEGKHRVAAIWKTLR